MGVLQHNLTMLPREGRTNEMLKRIGGNLREEAKLLPPFDECPTPSTPFPHEYYRVELQGRFETLFSESYQRIG